MLFCEIGRNQLSCLDELVVQGMVAVAVHTSNPPPSLPGELSPGRSCMPPLATEFASKLTTIEANGWDALAGKFFGMSFQEADEFNARHGHQFIADLMPRHPIYLNMLPESARSVIGKPHPSGRAAMRMLEKENFKYAGYIDIFDGGPTMEADIDAVKSVAESREATVSAIADKDNSHSLAATGTLEDFRCCYAHIAIKGDGEVSIDSNAAETLNAQIGTSVRHVPR